MFFDFPFFVPVCLDLVATTAAAEDDYMATVESGLATAGDGTISEQRIREIDDSIRRAKAEKLEPFNGY